MLPKRGLLSGEERKSGSPMAIYIGTATLGGSVIGYALK